MIREIIGVALFLVSVGLSGACLLRLVAVDRVGGKAALVWTAVLAVCWSAWYVVMVWR